MRVPVPLRSAYKLIDHGPTTLITSAHGGRRTRRRRRSSR
jgi:hypothetical protein